MVIRRRLLALVPFAIASALLLAQSPAPLLLPHEPTLNVSTLQTRISDDKVAITSDQQRLSDDQDRLAKYSRQMVAYHDCVDPTACYATDLEMQTAQAISYLERRAEHTKPGEKLAVVLDIDETSLSNWEIELQDNFAYNSQHWLNWYQEKRAPAIPGVLRLFKIAEEKHVAVFFITGRDDSQTDITAKDLEAAGYRNWAHLYLRGSDTTGQSVAQYKSGDRQKIADQGYTIILNVGDQMSDLNGAPQAELSVKLPNPFYYIP
jgi:5'-nucleotidase (lipoprotein e(P4) family)